MRLDRKKEAEWLGFFQFWRMAILTNKQSTIVELEMEFKILLVFVFVVGIAYVIFKIIEKKSGPWSQLTYPVHITDKEADMSVKIPQKRW